MQPRTSPIENDAAADPFGVTRRPRAPKRLIPFAAVLFAALAQLALSPGLSSVRSWLHLGSSSCAAAGISTSAAREGVCSGPKVPYGPSWVFNVVDRGHTLRMPEYQVRLLSTSFHPTTVYGRELSEHDYPNRVGVLLSFRVEIKNEISRPLPFATHRTDVDILISDPPGSDAAITPHLVLRPNGAPVPSVTIQSPIPPHAAVTGWLTIVTPLWAEQYFTARRTDLEFYRVDSSSRYDGQIRLWK